MSTRASSSRYYFLGGPIMYVRPNFKTKKSLREAVERGEDVLVFSPGLGEPERNGEEFVEGPHFPEPHRWYAKVRTAGGKVVAVLN